MTDLKDAAAHPSGLGFRPALPGDAAACVHLRGLTRQNAFTPEQLAARGITVGSWAQGIASGQWPGVLAEDAGTLAGYCFGDSNSGEILVLAVRPEYEGRGLGAQLLGRMVGQLRAAGLQRLFLGCDPSPTSRSHGFYRHLGWRSTGQFDAGGDEILELPAPG